MRDDPPSSIVEAVRAVSDALSRTGASHMIIGGIAVIARGLPRHTDDVDATIWGESVSLDDLYSHLREAGIEGRISDALEFAREHQVLLTRHRPTGTPMEITLAWLPFEKEALDRAQRVDFAGVPILVPTPEDLVIFKAVAWRDRDRTDIERLIAAHGGGMDLQRIRSVVSQFAEVLEAPERIAALDALIRKARG